MAGRWYVIHTYSGHEKKVKTNLEFRLQSSAVKEQVQRILLPTREVLEIASDGKRRKVERVVFPGYVLVEMDLSEELWALIRRTPGVTGFVGSAARPVPLGEADVKRLLSRVGEAEAPPPRARAKHDIEPGENVRIIGGPFAGFTGSVDEASEDHSRLRVMLSIFGRSTPMEVEADQVEKV